MSLFNMHVFGFKTNNLKKHNFLVKRGVATKRFFYQPVFAKCEKLSFFCGALFGANFGSCSKITINIGISAHFLTARNGKNAIFNGY